VTSAVRRDKQIRQGKRDWKLKLIEDAGPDGLDLAPNGFPENDPNWIPPEEPD
jgi:putative endonuclease